MQKLILLFFLTITSEQHLQLFDKLGVVLESLENRLVMTNGIVSVAMSLELKLPSMNVNESVQSCQAASSGTFKGAVASAMTKFRSQIKSDLSEYIDFEAGPNISEQAPAKNDEAGSVTVDEVKVNPLLCDRRDVACSFMPIIKPIPEGNPEKGKVGLQACYNSNLGAMPPICNIAGGVGICCSKHALKNEGKCPTKDIREALRIIARVERKFPNRLHKLGEAMDNVETRRLQNYCIALTSISLKGVDTKVGGYAMNGKTVADLDLDNEESILDWWPHDRSRGRRRRGAGRSKRSNWAYYTSGGFWTSTYIDQQVSSVKKAAEADAAELREAVQKNSKMLLTIEADVKERQQLRGAICGVSEEITEKVILDELQNAQSKLEFKSEFVLRSCSSGEVPDAVSNEVLEKLCTAASNSPHCYGAGVRALFRCRLGKPLITMDMIGITMSLTMSIPVEDEYDAFEIFSIGVPFSSQSIEEKTNLTDNLPPRAEPNDKSTGEKVSPDKGDEIDKFFALQQVLLDYAKNSGKRGRRAVVSTYHFLKIKSLPSYIAIAGADIVAFNKRDIISTPFGVVIDYSYNKVRDALCVKAIMDRAINSISHFCSIELMSSNVDCLVEKIPRIGYMLSSANKIDIVDNPDAKSISVFNNQGSRTCVHKVCIIVPTGDNQQFVCGKRRYFVESHEDVTVKVEIPKLAKFDLLSLSKRKTEISDLSLTGFSTLDRGSILSKKNFNKLTSVGTFTSLVITLVLTIVLGRMILRKLFDLGYYITCEIPCKAAHILLARILSGIGRSMKTADMRTGAGRFIKDHKGPPKTSNTWIKNLGYMKEQ